MLTLAITHGVNERRAYIGFGVNIAPHHRRTEDLNLTTILDLHVPSSAEAGRP